MKEKFKIQHRQMVELANAILILVRSRPSNASDELNRHRLRLSRAVSAHCTEESEILRTAEGVPDNVRRRYHDELLKWRHELIACNSGWPPQRVWQDPAGFAAAFRPIVVALSKRIEWEHEVFYPLVLAAA